MLWGKGSPAFTGKAVSLPETLCYPRPLQERVPIIVGGGGERRTLRLAARYADHANVPGDLATVRRKAEVLRAHCAETGREVGLSHLGTALVAGDDRELAGLVDRLRPPRVDAARYAASVNAGTVADHVGRFRAFADAGVGEVVVRLPGLTEPAALRRMADLIAAVRTPIAASRA